MITINDVKLVELPKFTDPRGNLSFVEQNNHIPFEIMRTYWIYDVPGGESRGGHAYLTTDEFIVAISGRYKRESRSRKHSCCAHSPYGSRNAAGRC